MIHAYVVHIAKRGTVAEHPVDRKRTVTCYKRERSNQNSNTLTQIAEIPPLRTVTNAISQIGPQVAQTTTGSQQAACVAS